MKKSPQEIVIYQTKAGALELRSDTKEQTLWGTQAQIAKLFDADRSVIAKHIHNILKDKELNKDSVCAFFAHTAPDGKTYQVQFYNLDVILGVGYRTNSARAISFRQWATRTLRKHILQGYTINKNRIAHNYVAFMRAVADVRQLLPTAAVSTDQILELISTFADTWFSLDAFDKGAFGAVPTTRKRVSITAQKLITAIATLKAELYAKGQASEWFACERGDSSIEGILGNVMQSFGGTDLYRTLEEKAANLLYFIVKNHPFVDGNKRSGAFAFVWFLRHAGILNTRRLTPEALTTLTLLVAGSEPKEKDKMIGLIMLLLGFSA